MRPSDIEWLSDVPEHWDVGRMANLFREFAEAGTDELPILGVSIHHGVPNSLLQGIATNPPHSCHREAAGRGDPCCWIAALCSQWQIYRSYIFILHIKIIKMYFAI